VEWSARALAGTECVIELAGQTTKGEETMPLRAFLACFAAASVMASAAPAAGAKDFSRNGDCEQVEAGKPVGWGPYLSGVTWGSLERGWRGKGMWFEPGPFTPIASGDRAGDNYINTGIVQGSSRGTSGRDAIPHTPGADSKRSRVPSADAYKVSFRIKSQCSKINVFLQGWTTDRAAPADRASSPLIPRIGELAEWTPYEAVATVRPGVRKIAVCFQVYGYEKDGLKLGRVCIDELRIERVAGVTADILKRIEIPADPAVYVGETPLEELLENHRAGDARSIGVVERTLKRADELAAKPDEWCRQFYASFEPRGIYTVACPIHPFLTRYYNDFSWGLDEPWKLVCQHCQTDGRKYHYYPNPDYPDDGSGCAPTDEVWARDHDARWSKAHRGIPHDHWNGQTNGYIGGKRYYFKGKYYANAMVRLERSVAPVLALAWHFATRLFPPGGPEYGKAEQYAHKAQVIMLCSARAYLGDDYLAAAEGLTPAQFAARMSEFHRTADGTVWKYEKLEGFRPFDYKDVTRGDPLWEGARVRDPHIYPGTWNWRANIASRLLEVCCRLRATFPAADDDIRRICQRPLVSFAEDRDKVALGQNPPAFRLKRGVFETEIHPFNLETGGDNLMVATMTPRIRAGRYLRDPNILEKVAQDTTYFWLNYFSQDGLGREGSPTYSAYGAMNIGDMLRGATGDFAKNAVYCDPDDGTLNLNRMPVVAACAVKMPYYVTDDDDHYISWEDSCYGAQRSGSRLARVLDAGGSLPEKHLKYLNIKKDSRGRHTVAFNKSILWPSVLLHDRRKAVLRLGDPRQPTVVSLDFTKRCGHYHPPTQTLMVHACGQELASDLGYMGASHFLTRDWIKTYPAHNCLTLRREDGSPHGTERLRGDLRRHFITTPTCCVVDSAEYDAADWRDSGLDENGEFSRQVLLMAPSPRCQYVVDVARGRGGHTHDYYLHCHGLGFATTGIELAPAADPDQDLYEYSGWTFRAGANYGAHNVRQLTAAKSTGPWQATWSRIDDYRGRPKGKPLIHDDLFMRLWMLDRPGSEVIAGVAPAQRYLRNNDFGRTMKVLCVRRAAAERVDNFVGVIEPYRDEPFIRDVRRLDPGTDDEYTVALAVDTTHGVDYIITYGGPGTPPKVTLEDAGHTITTNGDVAVASLSGSGLTALLVAGGGYVRVDDFGLAMDGPPQLTARLLDFDDGADTLTIESSEAIPTGDALAGLPLIVQHVEDRSTFTIASVERLDDARWLVRLDDQPHIVNNWLLVSRVDHAGILVEPPPVLDGKKRAYRVYGGEPGNLRLLGPLHGAAAQPIHAEDGTLMHSLYRVQTDDCTGVKPGQEIGITRLHKGRDTVQVTNFAYWRAVR